jgi:tetratricopeptide (TPR) repeat protein
MVVLAAFAGVVWFGHAPPTPDALFAEALAGLERGELEPFDRAVRVLEKRSEYEMHVRFLDGVALFRSGRSEAALQRFATLAPAGDLREPMLLYTAQALHAANRLPEAEFLLRTLVHECPENAEAHRWLGVIYYDLGAYDYAIVQLQELAKLVPDDYRPHRLIGLMYRDFEQDQEAIESYREALDRSPPRDVRNEILQELAEALVALRRYDEALEVIAEAQPTAVLETLKAQCLWSDGQAEAALRTLQNARRLNPTERTRILLEAEIRAARGDLPRGLELLREAVRLHPHDAECHYQLGLALRNAGLTTEAESELATWNRLKELATRLSQLNFQALRNPHDLDVREQLAEVCEELGKDELAAMWRQTVEALRTSPGPPNQRTSDAPVPSVSSESFEF